MITAPPDPIFVLRGSSSPLSCLEFIPTGEYTSRTLASGNREGAVSLWDLKMKEICHSWKAHNSSILWMKFLNENSLWTYGRSESVILWDISDSTPREKYTFPMKHYLGFSRCDVTQHESKDVILLPGQECVILLDVNSSKVIHKFIDNKPRETGSIMQCKFIKQNNTNDINVLLLYESGKVTLFNLKSKSEISEIKIGENPICVEFDDNISKGLIGTASEKLFVFSFDEKGEFIIDKEHNLTNPGLSSCLSRPDSKIYATGGWDNRIRLFSWKKHKSLAVLIYHKQTVECLAFSKFPISQLCKGYLLAAGSSDQSISLWNLYN